MKTETLYGIHPVREALRAGRRKIYTVYADPQKSSHRLKEILDHSAQLKIPTKHMDSAQIAHLAGSKQHQGVAAMVSPLPLTDWADMLKVDGRRANNAFFLILDNLMDPHNLGALVRTAACVGSDGLVLPKDRAAQPSPTVSKISAGSLEHLCIAKVTNLVRTIKMFKQHNVWIVGLECRAQASVFDTDLTDTLALVVGGEDKGLRPLVRQTCDFLVSIPQNQAVNSLNASVAGGVAMYEVLRQRRKLTNGRG